MGLLKGVGFSAVLALELASAYAEVRDEIVVCGELITD